MLTIKLKSRQKEKNQSFKNAVPLDLIFCFPWMCILATCRSCQPNRKKQSSGISKTSILNTFNLGCSGIWLTTNFHIEEMYIQIHEDR